MLYAFENQHLQTVPTPARSTVADHDLLAATAEGDEMALETLLARHRGLLQNVILRIMSNPADAEDVLQQCALETWKHASQYDRSKGAVLGWLITMARRRAIDSVRRRTSYESGREKYSALPLPKAEKSTAESEASMHDTADVVAKAMARLPANQADAVRLAFFAGMSQREIAKRTGIALGTIKTRLELGLNKLRSALMVYGDWKAEFALA
jgi:RNA polymerase sigma-70 factor (ECF subfamily)